MSANPLPTAANLVLPVNAPQSYAVVPEDFQVRLVESMSRRLLAHDPPSCLLRAPTGSGKTYVLSKVMGNVSEARDVLWFWFVPFATLVHQTIDALVTNAADLSPVQFVDGVNQDPRAGQVLVSTAQHVSRAAWRRQSYHAGGGELIRTPAEFVALARASGLEIGVVVDEAHIALDEATEFGQFVNWLSPQYLAVATATPKDRRIEQFVANAGFGSLEVFSVSRDDVVKARLNKAYIEAIIYELRQSSASVADLKATVLRQAWRRNQQLKQELAAAGVDVVPLMLVQVENGPDAVANAERDLIDLCQIHPGAIGKHSSDDPNPELMNSIANDTRTEVLIFKQSAGTGFDAPRAFVLASTKPVNDPDFATQFVGRVMRVTRQIRARFADYQDIPPLLNTAFVYLADASAQLGYQQAIQVIEAVKTQIEGEVEVLAQGRTRSGAIWLSNRPSAQRPITPHLPLTGQHEQHPADELPGGDVGATSPQPASAASDPNVQETREISGATEQGLLFDPLSSEDLDEVEPAARIDARPRPEAAQSVEAWSQSLLARGISQYRLRVDLPQVPRALKREDRPEGLQMGEITLRVATRLVFRENHRRDALLAARGRLRETETRTELTQRQVRQDQVVIVIDRNRIAAEAQERLRALPQIEEADHRILIETIAGRLQPRLAEDLEASDLILPESEIRRMSRTAACWIIRAQIADIEEALHLEIAQAAQTVDAAPLPDVMLFPTEVALPISSKNLYGVLPPSQEDIAHLDTFMLLEDRELMQDKVWRFAQSDAGGSDEIISGRFDQTFSLNSYERALAQALDRAPYVAWWFRNPERKPYAVRLVRGEHRNYFHPDFVVCLEHVDGAVPVQRLIETKHDLKDARRKSRHVPRHYGRVLFITQDGDEHYILQEDGSLGEVLDFSDIEQLREVMQRTAP